MTTPIEAMARAIEQDRQKRIYATLIGGETKISYEGSKKSAKAAYDALIAAGFAVEPVEPTEAMIEAGELASLQSSVRGSKVAHIYRAMCRAK
jgi:hypothetical protein